MNDFSLDGKSALVTGGGVGIGRGIALSLANAGADVAVTWHSHTDEGRETLDKITATGRQGIGMALDVTNAAEVDSAVQQVVDRFGHLDILVNNAGGLLRREALADMSDEHWHHVLQLNLTSAFYCSRAVVRHQADGGRIVNVASLAGHNGGGAGSGAYAAAKAGMFGLTRGLAKELGPRGITVNAVAPGLILDTPFHETFTPVQAQQDTVAGLPMGRAGYPDDVAAAVTWFCTPAAGWTTGEVININGGQYFL